MTADASQVSCLGMPPVTPDPWNSSDLVLTGSEAIKVNGKFQKGKPAVYRQLMLMSVNMF